jgi:hypothetical protein
MVRVGAALNVKKWLRKVTEDNKFDKTFLHDERRQWQSVSIRSLLLDHQQGFRVTALSAWSALLMDSLVTLYVNQNADNLEREKWSFVLSTMDGQSVRLVHAWRLA